MLGFVRWSLLLANSLPWLRLGGKGFIRCCFLVQLGGACFVSKSLAVLELAILDA